MFKLSVLAQRPDFKLGSMTISPSRRKVASPAGEFQVEPLVFKAFLLLLDARGKVVTREELFDGLWGGGIAGDDSLNRAIAGVREIATRTSPRLFEIETIPRIGYRLVGEILSEQPDDSAPTGTSRFTRRKFAIGGLAAASAGGVGLWSIRRSQADRQFDELVQRGQEAIRYGASYDKAVDHLQPAVALRPDDPKVQGLYAYALCMAAEAGDPVQSGDALQLAETAASISLSMNPEEPNARLAMVVIQRSMLDLEGTEDRLQKILAAAPTNTNAMRHLWDLLQSTGRSSAAWSVNARAIALHPMAAAYNFPRAQLLWILGRNAEADRVIDRAMNFWPENPSVRFARLTIFAFTNRARAALAMLEDQNLRPQNFTPAVTSVWRISLKALDQPSIATIAVARDTIIEAARSTPSLARPAVFMLSALGEVDAAFEIANELLLFQRPMGMHPQSGPGRPAGKSMGWRFTPWLFIPPTKAMRLDPRFRHLCDGLGLTEYWAKRGTGPDQFLMQA